MAAPKEWCPRHHGEIKPVDYGAYYLYRCNRCDFEIKTYKPLTLKPGEKKKFGPGS